MGPEYVLFRAQYEISRKLGILKKKFPTNFKSRNFISLQNWKGNSVKFFFDSREKINFPKNKYEKLREEYKNFLVGKLKFFNAEYIDISTDYDWITNPKTKYKYDINEHWTKIKDLDSKAGDIKYVWEKSRFSYLYLLIRYDYHFDQDNSKLVFDEILSWIEHNPINMGPNYKCSQEISLRILNWTFALFFYKNSLNLTEKIFNKIINSIYQQIQHVNSNINFSLKTVRNNHAITESLALYLVGLLYPFFPESVAWKKKGKKYFEQEIEYQIYEDGSYLQFSMNYQRVVVQLLTWAIILSKKNEERLAASVYSKAELSLNFLVNQINLDKGQLPNYGANDGALFFRLNNCNYRDYRPQLNSLKYSIDDKVLFNQSEVLEDCNWYGMKEPTVLYLELPKLASFKNGGYYSIRDELSFTFIRCGSYKDRPVQADNLHLDIWVDGKNILRDAGSYLYNSSINDIKFFNGTIGHNSIMLGEYDQMLKGSRFIWYYWTKSIYAEVIEKNDTFEFNGKIKAFSYLNNNIYVERKIIKDKNRNTWKVFDTILNKPNIAMVQIWNPSVEFFDRFEISAKGTNDNTITPMVETGWFSEYYGMKEKVKQIHFKTNSNKIITTIEEIA